MIYDPCVCFDQEYIFFNYYPLPQLWQGAYQIIVNVQLHFFINYRKYKYIHIFFSTQSSIKYQIHWRKTINAALS